MKTLIWVLRIVAAVILLQTLFFKFSGSEESVYIFSKLGVEPYGRYIAGISELITAILLLIPRTTLIGALFGIAVMAGAIASHIFVLGIEVQNDGGLLFGLAIIIFAICLGLVYLYRNQLPNLLKFKLE